MRTRPLLFLAVVPFLLLTLVACTGATVVATTPTVANTPAAAAKARSGFSSTIRLSNCSASLVRFPNSSPGDRAMMLTAGHCWEEGEGLQQTTTVGHRPSSTFGTVLDRRGNDAGTVDVSRLIYATEDGTDLALYRLAGSFADVRTKTGARPLTLSARGPAAGARVVMPSSALDAIYHCTVQAVVPSVLETGWTWNDAIRFAPGDPRCQTVNGTSGSPIIDRRTGLLVAVNNSIAPDEVTGCYSGAPCEVAADGTRATVPGARYAQQTAPIVACVTKRRTLDFAKPGCELTAPGRR